MDTSDHTVAVAYLDGSRAGKKAVQKNMITLRPQVPFATDSEEFFAWISGYRNAVLIATRQSVTP
jgi:hypothetical protein